VIVVLHLEVKLVGGFGAPRRSGNLFLGGPPFGNATEQTMHMFEDFNLYIQQWQRIQRRKALVFYFKLYIDLF